MDSPAVTLTPAEPTPDVEPTGPVAPRVAIAAGALALVLGAAGLATLAGTDASGRPALAATRPPAAATPAEPAGSTRAPAGQADAAQSAPGSSASLGAGPAASRPDSGRIGRWQQMGHEHSGIPAERRAASSPSGVLLIGDSSLTRTRPGLVAALSGRPVTWDHWNGRPTHGSVDVAAAIDGAGRLPRTLVVLSGSNDVFFPDAFAAQVERLLSVAGPSRRVVWVAPYVRRPKFADADAHNSAAIDAQLAAAAARHPNLHVVDWAGHVRALSAADAAALMPDGAHPSPAGCAQLTRMIVAALG